MQNRLQEYANWEFHRKSTYHHLIRRNRNKKRLQKQFNKQYVGEYNFRTGPISTEA